MSITITGVDWDSFKKYKTEEAKPIVFGIEHLMVSVLLPSVVKTDDGWVLEMEICRIITGREKAQTSSVPSSGRFKGFLFEEEKKLEPYNYGSLESVPALAA